MTGSVSPTPKDTEAEEAKAVLEAAGYVVVKAKSYEAAQRRQAIAGSQRQWAVEDREHTRRWAEAAFDEQRRLSDRLTFVYGVARAHGATVEELSGPAAVLAASPAVTEGERAPEFRSERLRRVITDALEDEGIAGCWCDDSNLDGIAATAAKAAEAWWLSTSLRTKPDFIQALIEADQFDWATATPVTMEELKARLDAIRNPAPASPAVTAAEDEK